MKTFNTILAMLFLLLACTSLPGVSFGQTINTIAGNGFQGFTGDGGPATSARLNNPYGVSVDAAGNVYIADNGNNRIRKVTASTGIISTIAGNGTPGYSGDGGLAINAQINGPFGIFGVCVDDSGNIYIPDGANMVVRKVTASNGMISTVAGNGYGAGTGTGGYSGDGGAATSAELFWPQAVFVDASFNLYIADRYNQRIRKVTHSTGMISTIAGDGLAGYAGDGGPATSARLNSPTGVTVDALGNVYIEDEYNNVIRKVNGTGNISTIAGNGTSGYSGDGGQATNAELYDPQGVCKDDTGNVYIPDWGNNRIRKVTVSTGIINTIAGNGTQGYTGDGGPATSAELTSPSGICIGATGKVYIADYGNNVIRAIADATTGINAAGNTNPGVMVYPNPSNGKFTVSNYNSNIKSVEVYNVFGVKIYESYDFKQKTANEIDLSGFQKGFYFMNIYDGENNSCEKIVIR